MTHAAEAGHTDVCKWLLVECGADVNHVSRAACQRKFVSRLVGKTGVLASSAQAWGGHSSPRQPSFEFPFATNPFGPIAVGTHVALHTAHGSC